MHTEDEGLQRRDEALARGERLIDLQAAAAWMQGQIGRWAAQGLRAELHPPTIGREKNGVWVDFEGPSTFARIVVRDSSEWEVERADPERGEIEVSPYRPATSFDELAAALEAELRRMRVLRG